ncbi:uncharacterized protein MONBRDRAFT_23736 [Monosiga brevicollis MX1]|uniref:TOG domain-containing protein n=1 Tax=Monosiga brevicollis TaxID=81824 RepID=A9UUA7_MONBE|nr:uncharacterized protein MONBRDRAFT_23736 [Monosiga brevicollis MX1]EDQ91390.1 predicted protein [Monosiga brevicollis MX1]|eukprot:XP_001743812.1 hypothetical protein [Monosiga brevicollis MX1]
MVTATEFAGPLGSHLRIDREKARDGLLQALTDSAIDMASVETMLEDQLNQADEPWESLHGALITIHAIYQRTTEQTPGLSREFAERTAPRLTALLRHREPRIRESTGQALADACARHGVFIYENHARDVVMNSIKDNLERHVTAEELALKRERLGISESDSNDVFHESEGWKTLETGCKALRQIAEACGPAFAPYITSDLLELVFAAIAHTNRFVRETGYYLCNQFVRIIREDGTVAPPMPYDEFKMRMAQQLAIGLADNWSQVRMAASVATRSFLESISEEGRTTLYDLLLPRLCINRYYVAAGVRNFCQEAWKELFQDRGRQLIAEHIAATVEFYVKQAQADNHAVREAACACIAELGLKIEYDALRPYVKQLLDCLLEAFEDESWPVRDAACIASGRFLGAFPIEAKGEPLDAFLKLYFHHLGDNIWSVRENAAVAIGNVCKSFGDDPKVKEFVLKKIDEMLPQAHQQSENSESFVALENVTSFGVAPSVGTPNKVSYSFNDPDPTHTDQQMFSCGSLAPKLKRKGGCMDCAFHRPQEPWERSDGCMYLLRELSALLPDEVAGLLSQVVDLAKLRHYKHYCNFLETLWKQLPIIAKNISKKRFKPHIQGFIPSMAHSLQSSHQLSRAAAEDCTRQLCALLGPTIFLGRVELEDPSLVPVFAPFARAH